jgi:hypothetical protein
MKKQIQHIIANFDYFSFRHLNNSYQAQYQILIIKDAKKTTKEDN